MIGSGENELGELLGTLQGHARPVDSIQISRDAKGRLLIVSGSNDNTIKIWEEQEDGSFKVRTLRHWCSVESVHMNRDANGRLVIVSRSSDNGDIQIWKEQEDGSFKVRILKRDGRFKVRILQDGLGWINAVQMSIDANGRLEIVSGSQIGNIEIWQEQENGSFKVKILQGEIQGDEGAIFTVQMSRDANGRMVIVSAGLDGVIQIWQSQKAYLGLLGLL